MCFFLPVNVVNNVQSNFSHLRKKSEHADAHRHRIVKLTMVYIDIFFFPRMEYYTARKNNKLLTQESQRHMQIERSQIQKRICYIISCIASVREGKSNP